MKVLVLAFTLLVCFSLAQARKRNHFHKFSHRERIIPMAATGFGTACATQPKEDLCTDKIINRWYYLNGVCYQYTKTCAANANSFETRDDCEKKCVPTSSDCELARSVGSCRRPERIKRYYYDKTEKKCNDFQACPNGEGNNFESEAVCNTTCIFKKSSQVDCWANPETNCRTQKFDAYTFDVDQNKCVPIKACSADGKNLFASEAQCASNCRPIKWIDQVKRDAKCIQIPKCTAKDKIDVVYFNVNTTACVKYIDRDQRNKNCTDGSSNTFDEQIDCVKACLPKEMTRARPRQRCANPPKQTSCPTAKVEKIQDMYFFNLETESCEMYSDCGDNQNSRNSFKTYAQCKTGCLD